MVIREAVAGDIPHMQVVRNAVKENTLSDPGLVTDQDCLIYITKKGRGWVCESGDRILGFSIVSLEDRNVWALFVDPLFENKGIGRRLHDVMMEWYFTQTSEPIWLSTAPGTRAEKFYRKAGWIESGVYGKGEIKFEMEKFSWQKNRSSNTDD